MLGSKKTGIYIGSCMCDGVLITPAPRDTLQYDILFCPPTMVYCVMRLFQPRLESRIPRNRCGSSTLASITRSQQNTHTPLSSSWRLGTAIHVVALAYPDKRGVSLVGNMRHFFTRRGHRNAPHVFDQIGRFWYGSVGSVGDTPVMTGARFFGDGASFF